MTTIPAATDTAGGKWLAPYVIAAGFCALLIFFWLVERRTFDRTLWPLLGLVGLTVWQWRSTRSPWWWYPVLLLAYIQIGMWSKDFTAHVHVTDLAAAEQNLFGAVPAQTLQRLWHIAGVNTWYDYLFAALYHVHYLFALAVAWVVWRRWPNRFAAFTGGFVFINLVSFTVYLLYPAAPPWMANQLGALSGVSKLLSGVVDTVFQINLIDFYHRIAANTVAAVPSVHAAWPWFTVLCLIRWGGKRALPWLLLPAGIWLATVYLGEHYVIDILAGVAVASLGFLLYPVAASTVRVKRP